MYETGLLSRLNNYFDPYSGFPISIPRAAFLLSYFYETKFEAQDLLDHRTDEFYTD